MAQTELAGTTVEIGDDGYLVDSTQWTPELANELAQQEEIVLTDKHFEVINFLRTQYAEGGRLSIRRIGKSGIVSIKEFYDLFPGGPLKKSSRIAGIPKPASCV